MSTDPGRAGFCLYSDIGRQAEETYLALEYWIIRKDAVPLPCAYFEVYAVRYTQIWQFQNAARISLRELSIKPIERG